MAENIVAISSDFLSAFAKLQRPIQGKVTEFINKFRNNPLSKGINYEKIHDAADKKMCSVRIDDTYRGIVARQEESGVYLLLWVDHHDDAYDWAKRKKCEINKQTGSVQVFDIQEVEKEVENHSDNLSLFKDILDEQFIALGVPQEQIQLIRSFKLLEEFYKAKDKIPFDAYESLEWIANGFPYEEVVELYDKVETIPDVDDFNSAIKNENSQRGFVIIEGEDELRRIMAEPLEKWRIFLHPTQRKITTKNYSGATRVLGGAGTGKTVVAMHRAKKLVSKLSDKEKILFTTYTSNLAGDIKDNLRKICTVEELRKIEVINLDQWVAQFLREQGYSYTIAYGDTINDLWDEAISLTGEDIEFSVEFFEEEWRQVVSAQEAFSLELYIKASRIGRGTRLDRKKRMKIWQVFEEYLNLMKENQVRDVNTAMYECKKILEKNSKGTNYKFIIVDEGQDFSANAYMLLRSLAGEEHANDIFIVGDSHQRIYKNKVVLSRCGINVRGRSSYLKINYRTTEEIRKYAFAFLKGISFDDLDEGYDDGKKCQSLTHGNKPQVINFKSADEEYQYLIEEIKNLSGQGTELKDICIVARTHKLLDEYIAQLTNAGIKTYEIKRNKLDERTFDGVRVATMHRVKGLEFHHVFVVAVNSRVLPLSVAINQTDKVSEEESITSEKCLLYVALTRAQKTAYITSYGKPSSLLV